MFRVIKQDDTSTPLGTSKTLYQCEECGFQYTEKEWAEKCEVWCKEHKSCNLEIIAHAVTTKDFSAEEPKKGGV